MDAKPDFENHFSNRFQQCYRATKRGAYLFKNATLLSCPVCGKSPLFVPALKVKKMYDWFTPLDGCPRCGYAYDREPGYFLFAVWAFSYISSIIAGFVSYFFLSAFTDWSFAWRLGLTLVLMLFFGFLFARHAKAYFIAFDQFFDPEKKPKTKGILK